jgi:hypothetical protein
VLGPRRFLAVATLVGTALWVSRTVLDMSDGGAGARVALFPSLPELIGLIVLAAIGLTLLQALLEHAVARRRPGAMLTTSSVLPAGVLAVLALPYLPYAPDSLPLLPVLAGPMRWWIWMVAVAGATWAIAATLPPRERPIPRIVLAAAPCAATALIVGVAMSQLAGGAIYPGGDEPHYLVVSQSLVSDGNLRIDDNHARGDYRAFYAGTLEPDHIVPPARDGAIYSIHPVGTSLLVAPGFARWGYMGASATILVVASLVGWLLWHALARATQSAAAATFGWLAVVSSAPFVLHGFAIYPEVPASLAVLAALWWRDRPDSWFDAVLRGAAIAVLPWLGTKYAPMAAVVGMLLVARAPRDVVRLVALAVPAVLSLAGWLLWFEVLWGTPSPTAPYGPQHQMALGNLAAGLPGLFFDQEYGIVPVTPVFAMAGAGWVVLWTMGRHGRRLVIETTLPLLALALTVGAYQMWWGGSAPPGRQVAAALPLLGMPLAALWRSLEGQRRRRGVLVTLLAIGIATSATFAFAQQGLLIANGRDGAAEILDYLSPSRLLASMAPSFTADRTAPGTPLLLAALWSAAIACVWRVARGPSDEAAGRAALAASVLVSAAVLVMSVVAPLLNRHRLERIVPARYDSLDLFDTTARPLAIVYDPMRVTSASSVPPLMRFDAVAGVRRAPQPVRVLLNMRLSLPAGRYRAELTPRPGAALDGTIGLQIGRLGPPQQSWTLAEPAGGSWSHEFALELDTNFVGFRGDGAIESSLARLVVTPLEIVDVHDRIRRPPVTATAILGNHAAYFHDAHADLEATGFWVRGRMTAEVTLGVHPESQPRGTRLRLHGGPVATRVRVATPVWSTAVELTPGQNTTVDVPALDTQRLLPVSITPEGGFVPADHGSPADRRLLGCWVEVVP